MSILREVTAEKHAQVEALPFVQYLLKGNISTDHYIIYMAEMAEVYRHLESCADRAGLLTDLPGLHRADRIQADLEELSPGHKTVLTPGTLRYLQYVTELSQSARAHDLFAHIYVRHLGDMYGGKLISRSVPGAGLWYQFENRAELVKAFNSKLSLDLADEAQVAFEHFKDIFQDIWQRINIANE
jgi:heme oxygenase